jgi:uncharacterized protein
MMRKLTLLLPALVLGACGATGQNGGAAPVAAPAGDGGASQMNTISVSGSGEVLGRPDTVVVDLGVSVLRPDVDSATSAAADLAQSVIDALIGAGVAEDDIQTTNYSLYPEYDYSNNQQRIVGYRVANTVRAKVRDVESAGSAIDAAVAAGGQDAVVNGVSFDIEDNQDLIGAAREAAWNDAKTKAEQLASLAGVSLGQAVTITETTTQASPPIFYTDEAAARDSATPIQPGQQSVSVVIQVVFAIGT